MRLNRRVVLARREGCGRQQSNRATATTLHGCPCSCACAAAAAAAVATAARQSAASVATHKLWPSVEQSLEGLLLVDGGSTFFRCGRTPPRVQQPGGGGADRKEACADVVALCERVSHIALAQRLVGVRSDGKVLVRRQHRHEMSKRIAQPYGINIGEYHGARRAGQQFIGMPYLGRVESVEARAAKVARARRCSTRIAIEDARRGNFQRG